MSRSPRILKFVLILVAGFTCVTSQVSARPGALDPTFGTDGVTLTPPSGTGPEIPADMARSGGTLIVAGSADGNRALVSRYLSNGSLDPGFGEDGQVRTAGPGWQQVEAQADGKIVLAAGDGQDVRITRLDSNGNVDPTFGTSGSVTLSAAGLSDPLEGLVPDASVSSLNLLEDGSLRAIGAFAGCITYYRCAESFIAGVDSDGAPSPELGAGGVKNLHISGSGILSTTSPDGESLVIRSENGDPPYGDLLFSVPVSADGTAGASTTINYGDNYYWATLDEFPGGLAVDPAGRVLLTDGGYLWRLLPDGSRDTGFGEAGHLSLRDAARFIPGGPSFRATGVAVDEKGRILLSGGIHSSKTGESGGDAWASSGAALRVDQDGRIDASFGGGGLQVLWSGRRAYKRQIGNTEIVADGGKLIASGLVPIGGSFGFALARAEDDEMEMPTCFGRPVDFVGTDGSDRVEATNAVVTTLEGEDVVLGGRRAVVCSGPGDDRVSLTRGHSTVLAGSGDDRVKLGDQDSRAFGGSGDDVIRGGAWRDRLFGDAGDDLLIGGNRDDRLFGGPGADRLFGGGGRDWLFGGPGRDALRTGPISPDPTDYLPEQAGGFMRVTVLGRKADVLIRTSKVCSGIDSPTSSTITMKKIDFQRQTGVLSSNPEGNTSLDDDFVWISDFKARVKNGRISGRFRYITGDNYYGNGLCRTGVGPFKKVTALKDAWVRFSAKAEPKPRQFARQD